MDSVMRKEGGVPQAEFTLLQHLLLTCHSNIHPGGVATERVVFDVSLIVTMVQVEDGLQRHLIWVRLMAHGPLAQVNSVSCVWVLYTALMAVGAKHFGVTVEEETTLHPLLSETSTVYVSAIAGDTVMDGVVSDPGDHS